MSAAEGTPGRSSATASPVELVEEALERTASPVVIRARSPKARASDVRGGYGRGVVQRGRPDEKTIDAVGKATEALEYVERARGHLYAFHQLIGRADFLFEEAAQGLAAAGHDDPARSLWRNVVGRDVLAGHWTFEIVEGFDDDYYDTVRTELAALERALVAGRRHAHEEQLRRDRCSQRAAYLEASPDQDPRG